MIATMRPIVIPFRRSVKTIPMTVAIKGRIKKELNDLPNGIHVTIDMTKSLSIDYDVLEVIDDFKDRAKTKNIQVTLIHGKGAGAIARRQKQEEMQNADIES